MDYARHADGYVLRFDTGEAFPEDLLEFLTAEKVRGGSFTGIGAVQRVVIAFFDTDSKEYREIELDEQLEVLALVGNVAEYEGKPLVHAHITLGRRDGTALGGHLRRGIVRPTLELTLRTGSPMHRRLNPEFGLPSLDFEAPQ